MKLNTLFALLVVICFSCTPAEIQHVSEVPEEAVSQDSSGLVQLAIASNVELTNTIDSAAVVPLYGFFKNKMSKADQHEYWLKEDLDRYIKPFAPIQYVEYDSKAVLKYHPMLMRIRNTNNPDERLLTVRWAAKDSTGTAADVRYVFDFISTPTPEGHRLALPIDYLTRDWQRIQQDQINYIISPEHEFSKEEAQEQAEQIEKLSRFFDMPAFPITFYSCAGPTDLFRAQGFQYHPLMYVHETGGMVDYGEYVWSGNDRDRYTHEIVHVFTARKFEERQALIDEGLATILGGSSDRTYQYHRKVFSEYLEETPNVDLREKMSTTEQAYIKEHTSIPYMVGALICEYVYSKVGKQGLLELMGTGSNPWPALNALELSQDNMNEKLRKQLDAASTFTL